MTLIITSAIPLVKGMVNALRDLFLEDGLLVLSVLLVAVVGLALLMAFILLGIFVSVEIVLIVELLWCIPLFSSEDW